MDACQLFNLVEGIFWIFIGVLFFIAANRPQNYSRRFWIIGGVNFVLFGLTDFIEIRSGTWWQPWWLLAGKALCLCVGAGLFIEFYRKRKMKQ